MIVKKKCSEWMLIFALIAQRAIDKKTLMNRVVQIADPDGVAIRLKHLKQLNLSCEECWMIPLMILFEHYIKVAEWNKKERTK